MNLQLLQFIVLLGAQVATANKPDTRSLAYLQLLSSLMRAGNLTDNALTGLRSQYEHDVANNVPVSVEYLAELDDRIAAQSDLIQSS